MKQDFQFGMARRIPSTQGFGYAQGRGRYDEAALRRDVAAAHWDPMSDVWIVLRQRGEIDLVEDGKARELRCRIGQRVWNPEGQQADERKYSHGW